MELDTWFACVAILSLLFSQRDLSDHGVCKTSSSQSQTVAPSVLTPLECSNLNIF